MTELYHLIPNLIDMITDIRPDSITSRTIYQTDLIKAVLFGFAQGQSLSEHRASQSAIIHILSGEATITLGADIHEVYAGAWLYMTPNLAHSVIAKSSLVMLLFLLPKES